MTRQRRRRRQATIVPPRHPPIPGADGRYHRGLSLDWLRSISECLHIDQDTESYEGGEVEGGNTFRNAAIVMLNYMDSTLTLAAADGRTGRHHHGGGRQQEYQGGGGGGIGDYLGKLFAWRGVRDRHLQPGMKCCHAGGVFFPPATPYSSREAVAPRMSLKTTTSAGGGWEGDAHKSE